MGEPKIFDLLSQISETSSIKEEVGQKQKIREDPIAAFLHFLQKQPDAAKQKDNGGLIPLHWVCYKGVPFEVVTTLLKTWPGAVKEKGCCCCGKTPLHAACLCKAASFDVVAALLKAWPEAVKEKDRFGEAPLHEACRSRTSFK
eukprot:11055837-Ditylum_brightwellii.AAC.1